MVCWIYIYTVLISSTESNFYICSMRVFNTVLTFLYKEIIIAPRQNKYNSITECSPAMSQNCQYPGVGFIQHGLSGIVIRQPSPVQEIQGSIPTFPGGHTSVLKGALPDSWHRISAGTGWSGVGKLWVSEIANMIYYLQLSETVQFFLNLSYTDWFLKCALYVAGITSNQPTTTTHPSFSDTLSVVDIDSHLLIITPLPTITVFNHLGEIGAEAR